MVPSDVRREELLSLARAAYRTEAPDVLRGLEAPPPAPGDTSPEAMCWYANWLVILLGALPPTERLTWQAAAQIIRLPDASLIGQVLDRVRQTAAILRQADVEPVLFTEADFARIFKPH